MAGSVGPHSTGPRPETVRSLDQKSYWRQKGKFTRSGNTSKQPSHVRTKYPLTIRAWWMFNYLQSVMSVTFDLRFSLSDHEYIGYAELIDLFTLAVGTYLFAISTRGKTGITLINSSITEPPVSPSAGQQTETERTCLYSKASVLDLVTISWMSPLFAIGYKKPLDKNDVPDIDGRDYADLLSDSFKRIVADVEYRHGISTLSF